MQILNRYHLQGAWPTNALYVGRGTPLGNPYQVGEHGSREEVVLAYRDWLERRLSERDPVVLTALAGIKENSALICSCAPKLCHAEIIREVWLDRFSKGIVERPAFHEDGTLPTRGEVFVFGSNVAGRHGAGAAAVAAEAFGATYGTGRGYMGSSPSHSYAIPTKDGHLNVRSLKDIAVDVAIFSGYARSLRDQRFFLTRVGCGLAGYKDEAIAPMFATGPLGRFDLPIAWRKYLRPPSMTYAGIGSRATPPEVLARIKRIAARLEERGYTLRSGGADGADSAFEAGCARKEIFLPWPGFNGRTSSFDMPSQAALDIASVLHPTFRRLAEPARKLMGRNSHQVLGMDLRTTADFVIAWTADGAESEQERTPATGGTGQAIALASRWGIPVFNLARPDALNRLARCIGA